MYSIRDKFREGLYDSEHKPRLNFARNYFFGFDADIDFQELEKFYLDWRNYDEYIVLQKQSDSLRVKGEVEKQTFAIKCSKRGNDVYWWRVDKRLRFLKNLQSATLFDPHGNIKRSNVLFATLTYDIGKCTVREACETVGVDFNNWIRNLRKKYGRISCFRCYEASKKGYLHIHVLMVFRDYEFEIAFSQLKRTSFGLRRVYRIEEKEEFEKGWHSFVDVQAIRELREGIRYITKYLTKTKNEGQTQVLTLALCWLFRKRTFAVSGDFLEALRAEIKSSRASRLVQTNLQGVEISLEVEYLFIGIFSAERLGIDRNEWRKIITDRDVLLDILN